jgi:hypothetical protein
MGWLQGIYAGDRNRRTGREGALWRGHFHPTLVETGAHLSRCLLYLDMRPKEPVSSVWALVCLRQGQESSSSSGLADSGGLPVLCADGVEQPLGLLLVPHHPVTHAQAGAARFLALGADPHVRPV